ncbi:MAG: putative membrane protein [Psychromonas sp.]
MLVPKTKKPQTVFFKQSNGTFILAFMTSESISEVVSYALPNDQCEPVLIQIRYQVAGIISLVIGDDLIYVDWPFEDAMGFMLSAGISPTKQK